MYSLKLLCVFDETKECRAKENLPSPCKIAIKRDKMARNGLIYNNTKFNVFLNAERKGAFVAGETLVFSTNLLENAITVSSGHGYQTVFFQAIPGGEARFIFIVEPSFVKGVMGGKVRIDREG